jgi:hypothetical protein
VPAYFAAAGSRQGLSDTMLFRPDGSVARQYGIKRLMNGSFAWFSRVP